EVGNGTADEATARRLGIGSGEGAIRHVYGGLGDAVHVDEPRRAITVPREPRPERADVQRLAAEHDQAQGELVVGEPGQALFRGHELAEGGRCLVQHCDLLAREELIEALRITAEMIRYYHQATTVEERSPHLPD